MIVCVLGWLPASSYASADTATSDDGRAVAVRYRPPVAPVVILRPFDRTASRYGPGHRGVDIAAATGRPIVAAASGVVTFAGAVAGSGVVVVGHSDGIRTTYEPVQPSVASGDPVVAGQAIGNLSGAHGRCAQGCLHWGARRGDVYLDPLDLLRPLGPVRLLPWI